MGFFIWWCDLKNPGFSCRLLTCFVRFLLAWCNEFPGFEVLIQSLELSMIAFRQNGPLQKRQASRHLHLVCLQFKTILLPFLSLPCRRVHSTHMLVPGNSFLVRICMPVPDWWSAGPWLRRVSPTWSRVMIRHEPFILGPMLSAWACLHGKSLVAFRSYSRWLKIPNGRKLKQRRQDQTWPLKEWINMIALVANVALSIKSVLS